MRQENMYLTKYCISRPNYEFVFKRDYTVIFVNEEQGIKKRIVDKDGNICEFPGIDYTDKMKDELGKSIIEPVIKYAVSFERIDDSRFIMVWTVRPDGRYWMDSWGFGAEDYESLSLYTYIDSNGNFVKPFQLYSIGYDFYGDYRLKGDLR